MSTEEENKKNSRDLDRRGFWWLFGLLALWSLLSWFSNNNNVSITSWWGWGSLLPWPTLNAGPWSNGSVEILNMFGVGIMIGGLSWYTIYEQNQPDIHINKNTVWSEIMRLLTVFTITNITGYYIWAGGYQGPKNTILVSHTTKWKVLGCIFLLFFGVCVTLLLAEISKGNNVMKRDRKMTDKAARAQYAQISVVSGSILALFAYIFRDTIMARLVSDPPEGILAQYRRPGRTTAVTNMQRRIRGRQARRTAAHVKEQARRTAAQQRAAPAELQASASGTASAELQASASETEGAGETAGVSGTADLAQAQVQAAADRAQEATQAERRTTVPALNVRIRGTRRRAAAPGTIRPIQGPPGDTTTRRRTRGQIEIDQQGVIDIADDMALNDLGNDLVPQTTGPPPQPERLVASGSTRRGTPARSSSA